VRGNITRRGKNSWRIKFDLAPHDDGKRQTRFVTIRGKRQDAERELTRLLAAADAGTLPEPSRVTIAEYIHGWLDASHDLAPKTRERYGELIDRYIVPQLGSIHLQRLKPAKIAQWHQTLLNSGGMNGRPLSARSVGHAHRVLHHALKRAVETESLTRNVASVIAPLRVEAKEVEILGPAEIAVVLRQLKGHQLYTIAVAALTSGARRGELLALPWSKLDLDSATMRVERTLEETRAGNAVQEAQDQEQQAHDIAAPEHHSCPARASSPATRATAGSGTWPPERRRLGVLRARWFRNAARQAELHVEERLCVPQAASCDVSCAAPHPRVGLAL
jgi:integrase